MRRTPAVQRRQSSTRQAMRLHTARNLPLTDYGFLCIVSAHLRQGGEREHAVWVGRGEDALLMDFEDVQILNVRKGDSTHVKPLVSHARDGTEGGRTFCTFVDQVCDGHVRHGDALLEAEAHAHDALVDVAHGIFVAEEPRVTAAGDQITDHPVVWLQLNVPAAQLWILSGMFELPK
eukprot:CAMPEP_0175320888 /NCGR_PEP_ID=MMETSP0093-20121207/71674_1 /TAXON_ID=311494 /ORGANISM="Alexandrium monilatum, Strain CCMP3105" /LENGTH=176 /DNA_ID=CAMNT_0016617725 /DNA_START=81 /DNA_END=612 /DNA_ORIENTATION=+